tara:strand:+ start:303 stop:461 length:159 start_codon:yes stop_codon:yes gene_type:complete
MDPLDPSDDGNGVEGLTGKYMGGASTCNASNGPSGGWMTLVVLMMVRRRRAS